MHELEPFYNWHPIYESDDDERSPFYGTERNEEAYEQRIYNYLISPYWDDFGSKTMFCKILFADYEEGCTIIELIGEWNDAVENDIMELKRSLADMLIKEGITKFILVMENVLNFHNSDDSYYEEWYEDLEESGGYVILLNTQQHVKHEMLSNGLGRYFFFLEYDKWRTHEPIQVYEHLDNVLIKKLN